jgi:PTS system nitrogen regulatory IIA component
MQLTIREAAGHLGVTERQVRQWIKDRGLPAHSSDERLLLNAVELWQWATENGVHVSRKLLEEAIREPDAIPGLAALLVAGGIHHDVPGTDRASVLHEVVARLPLAAEVDREFVLRVLEAREAMGSTGIGGGIAIPHVRNPLVLSSKGAQVTLCLLRVPVPFDAVDGQPVHALFAVVSPSVPVHLRILGKLGFVLRDAALAAALHRRATSEEILHLIERAEGRTTGSFRGVASPAE